MSQCIPDLRQKPVPLEKTLSVIPKASTLLLFTVVARPHSFQTVFISHTVMLAFKVSVVADPPFRSFRRHCCFVLPEPFLAVFIDIGPHASPHQRRVFHMSGRVITELHRVGSSRHDPLLDWGQRRLNWCRTRDHAYTWVKVPLVLRHQSRVDEVPFGQWPGVTLRRYTFLLK